LGIDGNMLISLLMDKLPDDSYIIFDDCLTELTDTFFVFKPPAEPQFNYMLSQRMSEITRS